MKQRTSILQLIRQQQKSLSDLIEHLEKNQGLTTQDYQLYENITKDVEMNLRQIKQCFLNKGLKNNHN